MSTNAVNMISWIAFGLILISVIVYRILSSREKEEKTKKTSTTTTTGTRRRSGGGVSKGLKYALWQIGISIVVLWGAIGIIHAIYKDALSPYPRYSAPHTYTAPAKPKAKKRDDKVYTFNGSDLITPDLSWDEFGGWTIWPKGGRLIIEDQDGNFFAFLDENVPKSLGYMDPNQRFSIRTATEKEADGKPSASGFRIEYGKRAK